MQSSDSPGAYVLRSTQQTREVERRTSYQPGSIFAAAELNDLASLDRAIKAGLQEGHPESVTLQGREEVLGMMPIHIASEKGHLECVQYLVKKRVDLDAGDNFRVTPLHLAAIEGHAPVVRALVEARCNLKPMDSEGDTPMHWAATKGHSEILTLLSEAGAPVDSINKVSWTPLHRAAYNGRREAVVTLVKLGASLRSRNQEGNTPLHLACFMNHLSVIETLLGLAARTDAVNVKGQTPLDLCITDAAREMLGANATKPDFVRQETKPKGPIPEPGAPPPSTKASEAPVLSAEQMAQQARDAQLAGALRAKVKLDDFPDMDDFGAEVPTPKESSTLLMRPNYGNSTGAAGGGGGGVSLVSDFLSEAASTYAGSGPNPYAMASGDVDDDRISSGGRSSATTERASVGSKAGGGPRSSGVLAQERSSATGVSRTSATQRPSAIGSVGPRLSTTSTAAAAGARPGARESAVLTGSGGLAPVKKPASGATARQDGWEGANRSTAQEFQARVKEENRRAAAAATGGAALLVGSGGGLDGGSGGLQRPVSGNKKFLAKYDLSKYNLFAP